MINLLRFTGVEPDYIIDETPTKIGKHIKGIGTIRDTMPEGKLLIIPVWNFYDEIKSKCRGKFLKYYPTLEIE